MYRMEEQIFATEGAKLYRAVCEDAPDYGLFFAVKEYVHPDIPESALYKERAITHEIENYASKCVVIPILQVLEQDGRQYGLMQMKENGAFLSDAIRALEKLYGSGRIPLAILLDILREILLSLEALHRFHKNGESIGYVHLDLHPLNIFLESFDAKLGEPGRAKFIDFLTARKILWKQPEGKPSLLEEARPVHAGTEGFAAPEVYMSNAGSPGIWTDIFAVCCIFYRLYTGKCMSRYGTSYGKEACFSRTFDENAAREEILAHARERKENPVIAHMLAAFIRCGIAENGNYRYQNAAECRETVQEIADCLASCGKPIGESGREELRPDYEKMLTTAWHMMLPEDEIKVDRIVFDAQRFEEAVRSQHTRLGTRAFDADREAYLFSAYWKISMEQSAAISREVYHLLLNDGLVCCNHRGDLAFARKLYRKLEENRQGMPLLDYFHITNNAAGTMARMYEHEEAYQIVQRNVRALGKIRRTQLEVGREIGFTDPHSFYNKAYARGLSALGMHMASLEARGLRKPKDLPWKSELPGAAFLRGDEEIDFPVELLLCEFVPEDPMTAFFMAHRLFGEKADNARDREITARHILHYAVQIKNKDLFERTAYSLFEKDRLDTAGNMDSCSSTSITATIEGRNYWGYDSLTECLEGLLKKPEIRFTLHIFLKGIYAFYMNHIDHVCEKALSGLLQHPGLRSTANTPVELIYRYLGMILWKRADALEENHFPAQRNPERAGMLRQTAIQSFRKAVLSVRGAVIRPEEPLNLRMLMTYQTKAIFQELTGKRKEEQKALQAELLHHAERSGWEELVQTLKKGRKLSELLVFEYC